jgi:hypothetical protein
MAMTLTHAAAVVAGLAIIASPFMVVRGGLFRSLVASAGLAVVAAAIIHAIAS